MRDGLGRLLKGVERIGGVGGMVPFVYMELEECDEQMDESESEEGGVLVSVLKR